MHPFLEAQALLCLLSFIIVEKKSFIDSIKQSFSSVGIHFLSLLTLKKSDTSIAWAAFNQLIEKLRDGFPVVSWIELELIFTEFANDRGWQTEIRKENYSMY